MDPAADRLVAALDLQHQRAGIRKAEGFHLLLLKKLHHLIIGHLQYFFVRVYHCELTHLLRAIHRCYIKSIFFQ